MGIVLGFLSLTLLPHRRPTVALVVVVLVCCLLMPIGCAPADIPLGSILRPPTGGQTPAAWASANKIFSLTFLPDTTRPSLYLAAITYTGRSVPLWTPAVNASVSSSGFLTLDARSGDLCLFNGSASPLLWHSSTSNLGVTAAVLDDTGNLRLVTKNTSVTVWQSFDHPTDTLLATQNFTTGQKLTSGDYTFSLNDPVQLTITWNDSIVVYSMGYSPNQPPPWTLSLQPAGLLQLAHPLLETPYVVATTGDNGVAEGTVSRFLRLDSDGNLRAYSYPDNNRSSLPTQQWAAVSDQCEVFAYCGNMGICFFNGSSPACRCPSPDFMQVDPSNARMGCKRKRELQTCPGNRTTVELKHTKFLDTPMETWTDITSTSDCSRICVANESCIAATTDIDDTISCGQKAYSYLSGYNSPTEPSNSYFKVCFPLILEQSPSPSAMISDHPPPPSVLNPKRWSSWSFKARLIALVVAAAISSLVLLEFLVWWFFDLY